MKRLYILHVVVLILAGCKPEKEEIFASFNPLDEENPMYDVRVAEVSDYTIEDRSFYYGNIQIYNFELSLDFQVNYKNIPDTNRIQFIMVGDRSIPKNKRSITLTNLNKGIYELRFGAVFDDGSVAMQKEITEIILE